jgi:hypothetical protein
VKSPETGLWAIRDPELAGLGFGDLTALDAAGANAQLLRSAINLGLYRAEVDAPAPAGDVMGVRDVVSELRTFAADLTNLSHDKTPNLNCSRAPEPVKFSPVQM